MDKTHKWMLIFNVIIWILKCITLASTFTLFFKIWL